MATLTNKATGKYTYLGANITTKSNEVTFTSVPDQLTIDKSLTPTSGTQGTLVTFTLTLTALVTLNNVTITDLLTAAGFTFVPGSVKINSIAQPGFDPNVGMLVNVLPAGAPIPVTFDATVT